MKDFFLLDPDITFLNHGSFGACPKPIFKNYQYWQKKLEHQPVLFFVDLVYRHLKESRISLSKFLGCSGDNIVFLQNPTTAISNIIYSLKLDLGDEILMSDHEYGAVVRAWKKWSKKVGVKVIEQPIGLPVSTKEKLIEDLSKGITKRTKVIFISHISSATALEFPVKDICDLAKSKKIMTIIDGAHAPGQVNVNLNHIDCDFFIGACHKWLCAPKGTSFLFAQKKHQEWLKPLIFSWGKYGDDPSSSIFLQEFQYQGTRDMSSFLTLPKVIEFFNDFIKGRRESCSKIIKKVGSELVDLLHTDPIYNHPEWINQMVSHPLPVSAPKNIKEILWNDFKIEIPIFDWRGQRYIRVSCNVYNNYDDMDYLLNALKTLF